MGIGGWGEESYHRGKKKRNTSPGSLHNITTMLIMHKKEKSPK